MKKKIQYLILVALTVVLIALVPTLIKYIAQNFSGLGPVPLRSAFAGRLPSVIEGDQRLFQFFYATNRANTEETFEGEGNNLGDEVTTGTFDVLISPGMPIDPFVWFDLDSMKWAGRQELAQDQFRSRLHEAVQASPQKSVLVVVWGFRDWFRSAALKTAYSAYVLDINTPVVLFDWPGNQGEGSIGYAASQLVATQSAPDLGRLLAKILRDTGAEKVWLLGSSLGCQTICDSLVWLPTQPDLFQGKPKIDHVVLSAPDVSAQAFDEKFAERIQALAKHLTAYVSSNDRALLMSHWINGNRRLGRKAEALTPPENRVGEYEFEEALELLDLQAKGAHNFSIVDASPINSVRNLHHFFTDSPAFFDDLYQRLLQPDEIVSRRLHSVRMGPQGQAYWILWND